MVYQPSSIRMVITKIKVTINTTAEMAKKPYGEKMVPYN